MLTLNKFLTIALFLSINIPTYLSAHKFLLIMGPSGVGKSTIINHLKKIDNRFEYIKPYTTRSLRVGETEKIHISLEEMEALNKAGQLLTINQFYGIYYATPKNSIDELLEQGKFPILDWPIEKMDIMNEQYENKLYKVYIEPDNIEELKNRLNNDDRDKNGNRYVAGIEELNKLIAGHYDQNIDLKIVNKKNQAEEIALEIYNNFIAQ